MKKLAMLSFTAFLGVVIYSKTYNPYQAVEHKYPSLQSEKPRNLRILLTDAPNDEVSEVFVNIDHVEILLQGKTGDTRVKTAKDFGQIDLLTLRDGVSVPMADVEAPVNSKISQIRFVLKDDGHYITKKDGSTCELQTPSQQQSGLKILVKQNLEIEDGSAYSLLVDFDAMKSIVQQGNGGCLLKPVLKLKKATKVAINDTSSEQVIVDSEAPEAEESSDEVVADMEDEAGASDENSGQIVDSVSENQNSPVVVVGNPIVEEEAPSGEAPVEQTGETANNNPETTNDQGGSSTTVAEVPSETERDPASEDSNSEQDGSAPSIGAPTTATNDDGANVDPYADIDPNDPSTWPNDYSEEEFAEAFPQLVSSQN